MKRLLRGVVCAGLIMTCACGISRGLDAADPSSSTSSLPEWISHIPKLTSLESRPFSYRIRADLPVMHLIFYASWAPPHHRALAVCDAQDGLPLIILLDGDEWVYDLIGGQITHFKSEPLIAFEEKGGQLNFQFSGVEEGKPSGISIDLKSFFDPTSSSPWKSTATTNERAAEQTTDQGARLGVAASVSDPPQPRKFFLQTKSNEVSFVCDGFKIDNGLPDWHHPLEIEKLMKDVPYLDATESVSADQEERLKLMMQLVYGGATFLLRPALQDPALQAKLKGMSEKLDFKQVELHEKLLKGAWLRALERQHFEPAKGL